VEGHPYPEDSASAMLHLAARMGPELRDIAREVERGRLTTVDAVKRELTARTRGLSSAEKDPKAQM